MDDHTRLLEQVRDLLASRNDVAEQRSIGGSRTFTVAGNMLGGVGKRGLMIRVGPQRYEWLWPSRTSHRSPWAANDPSATSMSAPSRWRATARWSNG